MLGGKVWFGDFEAHFLKEAWGFSFIGSKFCRENKIK
jgi:hypothetical protein